MTPRLERRRRTIGPAPIVAALILAAGCATTSTPYVPALEGSSARLGPPSAGPIASTAVVSSARPAPAPAATPIAQQFVGQGMSANASAGFTASPGTFLLAGEFLFELGEGITGPVDPSTGAAFAGSLGAGGLLQIGLDDDHFLFAPAAVARFTFDIPEVPQLRPFGEAGLGILIDQRVRRRRGRSDERDTNVNGLIVLGGGVEWMVRPNIGVGGKSYLNIAPGPGEDFFISFLGGATFHF